MTPKKLLEKHNGDPLAATVGTEYYDVLKAVLPKEQWDEAHGAMSVSTFVRKTLAHLGKDGGEKWGRVLLAIIACLLTGTPIDVFSADFALLRHTPIEPTVTGADVTRIANATDRERLAACIVALAEVEGK